MIVMGVGHLLVAGAAVTEIVTLGDAGVLEQFHGAIDRGDRNAVVDRRATPVEFLNVGMVVGRRQYARDHAALFGHAHALGGAERFDVFRFSSCLHGGSS